MKCRNKVQSNTAIYIYTGICVGSSCQRRCSLLPWHFNTVLSTRGEHLSYNMYITTAPSLTMKWTDFDHVKRKKKKIQLCGMFAELNLFWLVGVDLFLYWFLPISSQWEEYSVLSVRANFHTCTSPFLMFNSPTTCLSLTNNYFHFCYSWTSSKSLKKKKHPQKHLNKKMTVNLS